MFSQHGVASEKLLESINITDKFSYSIIDLRLNQPVTVTSYAPLKEGDLLRVRVRSTSNRLDNKGFSRFEFLPWEPTAKVPLFEVTVDLDNEILFHFKRKMKYELLPASSAFHILVKVFHPARITTLPPTEKQSKKSALQPKTQATKTKQKASVVENPVLAGLMDEARKAMLSKDYKRAIRLYSKVVFEGENTTYYKEALEYLGLARERNLQFAHAKNIYEKYLQRFPKGEDADRVRQRLMGIITAQTEPKEKLKEGKSKDKFVPGIRWDVFGSFYQLYNRFETKFNDEPARLNRSSLQSGLDLNARLEYQEYMIKSRFSGSYNATIEDSEEDESRIHSLFIDFLHQPSGTLLRIGRQSSSSGGVLGRFDGGYLSLPMGDKIRINLVGGFPVLSSRDIFINKDVEFYGINADLGPFFDSLDFNIFYIEQHDHGLLDRRAVGGEINFFQENKSFFSFVDYDIYHQTLNSFLFTGQWVFEDRTAINLSYDYRTSPYLTTSNATQGQNFRDVETLDQLQRFFSTEEIKQIAKDRTADSQTWAVGLSRPLTENLQFNGDFRASKYSSTNTSGGVEGSNGTDYEYTYSFDLTANSIFIDGDIYVFGVRFRDMERATATSFRINARYPVTRDFRINPRFRFNLRDNDDGTKRYSYQPSVRMTYRLFKGLQLELEAGGEWESQGRTEEDLRLSPANDQEPFDQTKGYFLIVGYRYIF